VKGIVYLRFTIHAFFMRLDLFLKASRLCPRRTVGQKLCDAGLVLINGNAAKAGHRVKAGDEVTLRRRNQLTKVRVLGVPLNAQIVKSEAHTLYEVLSEVADSAEGFDG
jgi:ribosomal 50S subunit-recycling heat shock protein